MRPSTRFAFAFLSGLALAGALPAPAAERALASHLSWLAGCWAAEGGEAGSGEQWTAPAGGTLLGISRTVRGGRTVAHEFLLIRETEEGGLVYVAAPSGQAETTFTLVARGEREVVFENAAHDFPQRIRYRSESAEKLVARIEGSDGERARAVEFPLRRISCSAPSSVQDPG